MIPTADFQHYRQSHMLPDTLRLLLIDGILDITDVKLNGASENVTLDEDAIPVRGDVSG
jgi:hypothetical protein